MTIRARYERTKIAFLVARAKKSAEMAEQREKTRMQVPEHNIVDHIVSLVNEIQWTTKGNIDNAWLQTIVERDFDYKMGRHKSRDLAKKILILHPEIVRD